MSFTHTVLLGALAGFTIYLGLPVGRVQLLTARARVALAMFSIGVLAFIFVDVLSNGMDIVNSALDAYRHGHHSLGHVVGHVALLAAGFAAGGAGLAVLERRMRPAGARKPPIAGAAGAEALTDVSASCTIASPLDRTSTKMKASTPTANIASATRVRLPSSCRRPTGRPRKIVKPASAPRAMV